MDRPLHDLAVGNACISCGADRGRNPQATMNNFPDGVKAFSKVRSTVGDGRKYRRVHDGLGQHVVSSRKSIRVFDKCLLYLVSGNAMVVTKAFSIGRKPLYSQVDGEPREMLWVLISWRC